ncbi:L-threonine ammonia-lyase-like isoform X2 [Eriocheir sinensis]|nr:L-threonine ammonia-lyase-like isoform X2 [Eriocheir sinensis]XP_050719356.1 L-threonine ammonia-lyase-like isoform X2 [Eriocheir sinensis]
MVSEERPSAQELAELVPKAANRLRPYILRTPLLFSPPLSKETSAHVYLKLENEQVSGSVKARGAFNRAVLMAAEGVKTVYVASSGNLALAAAIAFSTLGLKGKVVIPTNTDEDKKRRLKEESILLVEHGTDFVHAETFAIKQAQEAQEGYLSPTSDYQVMAGQGTTALEILEDLPQVDAVFVTVGGGALISGMAAYIKTHRPSCKVVGCSPFNSRVMHNLVHEGHTFNLEMQDTLSDATAGGVIKDAVTVPMCQEFVDQWVLVDEEQIAEAICYCLKEHKKVIEGAAGVALAAFRKVSAAYVGKNVAVVICGANISMANVHILVNNNDKTKYINEQKS